jgi:hypothetical protein
LVHETLHRTRIDGDLIQDSHYFVGCDGECVNFLSVCDDSVAGKCENQGLSCDVDDVCTDECEKDSDCGLRGFPDWYVCEGAQDIGFAPRHCVPPECADKATSYCNLYRRP